MEQTLLTQAKTLRMLVRANVDRQINTRNEIGESLNRLRNVTLQYVPSDRLAVLEQVLSVLEIHDGSAYSVESGSALVLCDQIISILAPHCSLPPTSVASQNLTRLVPEGTRVFIIHGHDTTNTLRLRTLLKERYGLTPVILSEQPSKGRSIIEKFETEARDISYAFALLTSDDFTLRAGQSYPQARPNVLFEIGWFYGRLGRDRVTILFQEGTSVPSDLDGILRVQFHKSIEENLQEIETELRAAGLLPDPRATEA